METTELQTVTLPRIGDDAPAFQAVTTQGDIRFPDDFSGKWVIFFSHPADFTPVSTSEFMTFAHIEPELTEIVLRPTVTITDERYRDRTLRILQKTETACLISHAVRCRIVTVPAVTIE